MGVTTVLILLALLNGCATNEPLNPAYFQIDSGKLSPPNITLKIPGLGPYR
jgi:hypothetical protein